MSWVPELPFLVYAIVFLSFVFLIKHWMGQPVNIPPCPCQPLPILGHLFYLKKNMRERIATWTRSTGDMMSLYFGSRLVIFLNTYDVAHEAFVKNANSTSDRPDTLRSDTKESLTDENGRFIGTGIATSNGYLWKEQRAVSLQILRNFGMGKNILAHKVQEEVSTYMEALAQLEGKPSDVRTLTSTAISNIIFSIVVGKRFDYDDRYFLTFIDTMGEYMSLSAAGSLMRCFKWLRFLPGDLFKARRRFELFNYIMDKYSNYQIDRIEQEYDENNVDNYIAAYLSEMKKMNEQGKETTLDKNNLARSILQLFGAGTETTATTIVWFFLYMLHYPTVQAKVYQEICEVVGTNRSPTMQDKPKLNYTNAAIQETMRLASILPIGLEHMTITDITINGYNIPAGTSLFANYDAINLCPQNWENPLVFAPERFLNDDGNLVYKEEFTPFSMGRRICMGESLAKMELFLYISNVVQKFEILPETPDALPPRKATLGITCPPEAFQVRFVER